MQVNLIWNLIIWESLPLILKSDFHEMANDYFLEEYWIIGMSSMTSASKCKGWTTFLTDSANTQEKRMTPKGDKNDGDHHNEALARFPSLFARGSLTDCAIMSMTN